MLLELGRLWFSVDTVPFSVGEEGYEEGRLTASSDSHDSLDEKEEDTQVCLVKVQLFWLPEVLLSK